VPEAPQRPWIERYGPVAVCLLLILLLSWAAWRSLSIPPPQLAPAPLEPTVAANSGPAESAPAQIETTAPGTEKPESSADAASAESARVAAGGEAAKPQPDRSAVAAGTEPTSPSPHAETADTSKVAKSSTAAAKSNDAASAPAVPSGSSGLAEKTEGVLLRYNTKQREWERLTEATPLDRPDRLLCLAPFRASITLGKTRMTLVGETEVRILSLPSDPVPALELVQGRLLVRQSASGNLKVVVSDRTASLEIPTESSLALERMEVRTYGQPITRTPPLAIFCIQGDVSLTVDQKPEPLKALEVAVVDTAGQVKRSTPDSLPGWVTQTELSPYELQLRDQFLPLFHPGRPVLAEIVVATEDDRPEIKRLAVSALQALGDLSYLMPILKREGDPVARRSAIAAIRAYMGRGPDAVKGAREQLDEEFGAKLGALAQHMLVGYSPDEVANRDTYARLVGLLSPEQDSVGIRELALDTLKRLTGRDDLGYDPDHPSGKGLEAWNDLLRRNELRPLTPRPKAK